MIRHLKAAAAFAALVMPVFSALAATPAPPSNLCIQGASGKTCAPPPAVSVTTSGSVRKWNPGHYVRPNAAAFPESADTRQQVYALTKNNANLKGGLITVPWGSVERSEGVYDFSQIDRDLAYLKSIGKKLIIEVWWQKYGGAVPDTRYFPQYIFDANGVDYLAAMDEHHVKMNEQKWADRYVALQAALAARYDDDPDVEQIIITETASTSAQIFRKVIPQVAQLWKKTAVVVYMNWVDNAKLAADLAAICNQYGVGIGGPDILPPKPIGPVGEDHGSRALRGAGPSSLFSDQSEVQDFGNVDYRGKIPVSYSYETLHGLTPAVLLPYAQSTLKATHIAWSVTEDLAATLNWSTGVLPVLSAAGFPIQTARPTSWK